MRGAERVVLALGALGEAGQAAALAQGADAVAAAGQDLVRIGLVADVPDQPVARGVEDLVQGDGQLDDAEAGAQMAAGHRHRVDGLLAQLVRRAGAGPSRACARRSAGVLIVVEQRRPGRCQLMSVPRLPPPTPTDIACLQGYSCHHGAL